MDQASESLQRAEMTHLHGAQAHPQPIGDLGERKLLDITEFEKLSVRALQLVEDRPDVLALLVADGMLARARVAPWQSSDRHRG
jgi:hypothetical protein